MVCSAGQHIVHAPLLDDTAGVHHRQPVRDFNRCRDVMGDKNHGHAELALQLPQQQQNLDLHRGVQRSGGFVGQQQLGSAAQGQCNHGALAHATRQFVRISIHAATGLRNLHAVQHLQCTSAGHGFADRFVRANHLGHLLADGVHRVKRQPRFLEHHGHHRAPVARQGSAFQRQHVLPVDGDAAADLRALRRVDAQQRAQRDTLARTGFTQQTKRLTKRQREVDAVQRLHGAVAAEGDVQVANRQQRMRWQLGHAAAICCKAGAAECPEPTMLMWQATACKPMLC